MLLVMRVKLDAEPELHWLFLFPGRRRHTRWNCDWSSDVCSSDLMLPLHVQDTLPQDQHEARALEALEWVGMDEAQDRLPADLSGGMKKRVGLARAIVARPHLLFLDEPSAGLDPISSVKLDRLILDIRALADDGIFLDADLKRPIAHGKPTQMRDTVMHPTVQAFMRRQEIDTL